VPIEHMMRTAVITGGGTLVSTVCQLFTRFAGDSRRFLVTDLAHSPCRPLRPGELASHPDLRHPRRGDFLGDGRFVFGNGGVVRMLDVAGGASCLECGRE
jgi:hypothetical protein